MSNAREKQRKKEKKKQKRMQAQESPIAAFMNDWGRVVIPGLIILFILILKYTGVIGDKGLAVAIGLFVILGGGGAMIWMSVLNPFEGREKWGTAIAALLLAIGVGYPFVKIVYPGTAAFMATLTEQNRTVPVKGVSSGYYMVQVKAPEMIRPEGHGSIRGKYRITFDKKVYVHGELRDVWHQSSGRRGAGFVEDFHQTDVQFIHFPDAPKHVTLLSKAPVLGDSLVVKIFDLALPPWFAILLALLAFIWTTYLDAYFPDLTERIRFAPWSGAAIMFLVLFLNSYEPTRVTSQALWSAVLGGIVGFVGGWAISLIPRLMVIRRRRGIAK